MGFSTEVIVVSSLAICCIGSATLSVTLKVTSDRNYCGICVFTFGSCLHRKSVTRWVEVFRFQTTPDTTTEICTAYAAHTCLPAALGAWVAPHLKCLIRI